MEKVPREDTISDIQSYHLQVYANCVRSSMIYGNETRLLLADDGLKFETNIYAEF